MGTSAFGAFVQIAALASKREIFDIVAGAVLTSDYVLDLMRHRAMLLAKPAVLATISGPVTDKQPDSGISSPETAHNGHASLGCT